jgi:hypothetical protein
MGWYLRGTSLTTEKLARLFGRHLRLVSGGLVANDDGLTVLRITARYRVWYEIEGEPELIAELRQRLGWAVAP